MAHAFLGLGSNLGDRMKQLKQAVGCLSKSRGIEIASISSIYETEPIGNTGQPSFLNCVVAIDTDLPPKKLLSVINGIEFEMKRERTIRWGPRSIDIDILLYDDIIVDVPELVVPHPRVSERAFVLVPLLELEPEIIIPGAGRASEYLAGVNEQGIKKLAAFDIDDIMGA